LDGSTYADGIEDNFILTTEGSDEKIDEDLQDLFLVLIEEKSRLIYGKNIKKSLIFCLKKKIKKWYHHLEHYYLNNY